ncbi:MAG: RnfABCDGE type electron transport complex subunit D [Bacteroidia bacterium]
MNAIQLFWKDARHFQLLYLGTFLGYGIWQLGWDMDIKKYLLIALTALITQIFGAYLTHKKDNGWKSALITTLGLCLLFKANAESTMILGAFLAIASKFVLKYEGKHIFNPANFGIIVTILLTQDAWISPGQWGSGTILLFLVGALGTMIIFKVGRIDISLGFLGALFLLQFSRTILYLNWGYDVLFQQFTSGSLLLFTFFMITDPMTTPNHKTARLIWSVLIALCSFILMNFPKFHACIVPDCFVTNITTTAPVWVLFIFSPLTILFDKVFKGSKFEW